MSISLIYNVRNNIAYITDGVRVTEISDKMFDILVSCFPTSITYIP